MTPGDRNVLMPQRILEVLQCQQQLPFCLHDDGKSDSKRSYGTHKAITLGLTLIILTVCVIYIVVGFNIKFF